MPARISPWPAALMSAGLGVVVAVVLSLGLGAVTFPADARSNPAAGATGADGPAGADGRDGVDGRDGADGVPGVRGPRGASGPAGRDGVDGHDGIDGADGADGAIGAPGPTGATGAPGAAGAPGATGPTGATGAPGPAGDDALVAAANHPLVSTGGGAAPTPLHGPLGPGTYLVAVSWSSIQTEYPAGPPSDTIHCRIGTIAADSAFTPIRRIQSLHVVEFQLIQSGPTFSVFRKSGGSGFGVIELAAEAQLGFACDGSSAFRGAGFWDFSSAVWQAS